MAISMLAGSVSMIPWSLVRDASDPYGDFDLRLVSAESQCDSACSRWLPTLGRTLTFPAESDRLLKSPTFTFRTECEENG